MEKEESKREELKTVYYEVKTWPELHNVFSSSMFHVGVIIMYVHRLYIGNIVLHMVHLMIMIVI